MSIRKRERSFENFVLFRSSSSLADMGDLSSSTIQNQPSSYADESDEGLVGIFFLKLFRFEFV